MNYSLKKEIGGLIVGLGIMAGVYNPADIDPVTNVKYEEIIDNPERDVYYILPINSITNDYVETSHNDLETARKSVDGTQVILKYDVGTVVRGVELGTPYSHSEILEYIQNIDNGFIDINNLD